MVDSGEPPIIRFCKKNQLSNKPKLMPLVHTTKAIYFRNIMESCCLRASTSAEPGRGLFFFYGRPAYHEDTGDSVTEDPTFFPVCLVVKPGEPADIFAIYPFDTGAYQKKEFANYIEDMDLHSFYLGNNFDIPPVIVATFFGSNRNYYFGTVKNYLDFSFTDFEANRYHELVRANGKVRIDDRRYTIEVQFKGDYRITDYSRKRQTSIEPEVKTEQTSKRTNKDFRMKDSPIKDNKGITKQVPIFPLNIVAVVLPSDALADPQIRSVVLEKWKAFPILYNKVSGWSPLRYKAIIFNELQKYYESNGYLEAE